MLNIALPVTFTTRNKPLMNRVFSYLEGHHVLEAKKDEKPCSDVENEGCERFQRWLQLTK